MRLWLSTVSLCLCLATSAAAQPAPPRLGQLHDALRLRADQEDGWRAYEAAIAPSVQGEARHRATQALLPHLTTPRRIALLNATMEQDLADLRRQGEAVVAFYQRLSPEQQATFDRQTLQAQTASGD